MLKQLSERIVLIALALVLLIWGGYHFYRYTHSPIQTETAYEYSVTRTIAGRGIAIREERVIEGSAPGTGSYLFPSAARVSIGETVAEFYSGSSADRDARRMRELEAEIEMLQSAQDQNINNFSNVDVINREIRDRLGSLVLVSSTGRCDALPTLRQDLTSLVNRRQVATGKVEDFQSRIAGLAEEYQTLNTQTSAASIYEVKAPVAGYFSRSTDGFELVLTPKLLESLTISDYLGWMEHSSADYAIPTLGRMVTNQVWYLAVAVELHQTEWISIGQTVHMEFEGLSGTVPAVVTDIKLENQVNDAIILLECDYMTEEMIDLRIVDVKLHSARHTGLRISTDALRFLDGVRGVYVVDDNTVQFRKLSSIYEEQSFVLSEQSVSAVEEDGYASVKLYDQVITRGIVYDGMPVQ